MSNKSRDADPLGRPLNSAVVVLAIAALGMMGFCAALLGINWYMDTHRSEHPAQQTKYELEDMGNGIYATYYETYSTVPAYNKKHVSVRINGKIVNYNVVGVGINFTDGKPYILVTEEDGWHSSGVDLWIPDDGLKMLENAGVGD